MAGAEIVVDLEGIASLVGLARSISDPEGQHDMLDAIGMAMVTSTQHRFETGVGPDGKRWKESLRAELHGGQTLRDTDRLYQSFTHNVLGHDGVEWGTNVAYAGIHNFGGVIEAKDADALAFRLANGQFVLAQRVTIPARTFMGVDVDDREEIVAIGGDWLLGGMRQ